MWTTEVSIVSKATPEAIWRLWIDVAHWHRWDDARGETRARAHG